MHHRGGLWRAGTRSTSPQYLDRLGQLVGEALLPLEGARLLQQQERPHRQRQRTKPAGSGRERRIEGRGRWIPA